MDTANPKVRDSGQREESRKGFESAKGDATAQRQSLTARRAGFVKQSKGI